MSVPPSLKRWFVVHFVADLCVAVPLFLAPRALLGWLGWPAVDPLASRLVAAALFGIGVQSWLGRNGGSEEFRAMLSLKVIWSGFASLGILWSMLEGGPAAGWLFLAIFVGFNGVWSFYRWRLRP
jgi:hypothetical protein